MERELCVYDQLQDWVLYIQKLIHLSACVWGGPHTCGYMCRFRGGGGGSGPPGKSQVILVSIKIIAFGPPPPLEKVGPP